MNANQQEIVDGAKTQLQQQTIACAIKAHTICKGTANGGVRCGCSCHGGLIGIFNELFGDMARDLEREL